VFHIAKGIFKGKKYTPEELEVLEAVKNAAKRLKEPEPEDSGSGDSELDTLLEEGRKAISVMGQLRRSIPNKEVERKILKIEEVSQKILDNAVDDRRDIPKTRKFLKYYLPTTIKLLHAYDRMSEQGLDGDNVGGTIRRIEDMLDDIIAAYYKQLDAMFDDEALDIETDIRVLEATMKKEGLK
jgi:5-bromo-4-chloroindolyl phosphate hydrolysis protein